MKKFMMTLGLLFGQTQAADLLPARQIGLELARDIAQATVEACRKQGYQVSAVVVDRSGDPVVVMRDTLASRYTLEIAKRKAGAAVLGGVATSELARNRADIKADLNHIPGILILAGGVPIRAAGMLVGAVGVSGAPGGDKDEACARAG
ncbi:MAG: heme-binding protein, partial [Gammaproteobacteria bacterium]